MEGVGGGSQVGRDSNKVLVHLMAIGPACLELRQYFFECGGYITEVVLGSVRRHLACRLTHLPTVQDFDYG